MIIHTDIDDLSNFYFDEDIYINSCGIQKFDNMAFGVVREHGRLDYHILIIKSGICSVEVDGQNTILKENDMIIYPPHQKQKYSFISSYSESYWLHFGGIKIPHLLAKLNLDFKFYHINHSNEIFLIFNKLIKSSIQKNDISNLRAMAAFIELLCNISEDINPLMAFNSIADELIIYLHNNYTSKFSLETYSMHRGYSSHRLAQLFKERTGVTPNRYKLQLQLDEGKWLLKNSTLSIKAIAEKIGISDPLYFSRIFSKKFGCSPSEFKKNAQTVLLPEYSTKLKSENKSKSHYGTLP